MVGYINGNQPTVNYHGTNAREARTHGAGADRRRSVYRAGLATVDWSDIPVTLEDIERIESGAESNARTDKASIGNSMPRRPLSSGPIPIPAGFAIVTQEWPPIPMWPPRITPPPALGTSTLMRTQPFIHKLDPTVDASKIGYACDAEISFSPALDSALAAQPPDYAERLIQHLREQTHATG
ncbi:hypothetical protein FQR65_LT20798 [Abscondita terminalis]|nr:hypothetical protein FQR65_LT20798 [Abscondita terminalis]